MGLVYAGTTGLVAWLVLWAIGIKAFDAFLVTVALVVVAATARMVKPFVDQLLGRDVAAPVEQGVGER